MQGGDTYRRKIKQTVTIDTYPEFHVGPNGRTHTEVPHHPDDKDTMLQTIGSGLLRKTANSLRFPIGFQ